ncbi:calmodulin-binding receptor-like cytoplasmic kinase 1 isoform X3 [Rhododendron vialii]|uniref:calmodulin-binding receptor-like cytoplasmic kinase 1 isoform X3 n=1 Tax=Rhododendron vialii TaxID=182163 RepID=UPI00265E4DE3|nr:calmodulin-binding receptor-like cytoplasmic kinase 1 isoform X3 [Rhododendron vialii]
MKKTSSPRRIISSGDANKDHNFAGTFLKKKTQSVLSRFRAAVFFWQRKGCSNTDDADEKPASQVIGIPSDNSTGSRSKIPLSFKHSYSSVSFDSTRSQAGTVTYSLEEISKATGNFSLKNILGEGSFGTVYKGKLKDGSFVAVKRAKTQEMHEDRLFAEFKNEILALSKIEHLNLVRLLGYIEDGDERIIVVEYVGNGTLREHLDVIFGAGKSRSELEMAERLDIAIDVAHAVTYLHMYTDRPIIHRDIKASNILITEKFRAKVADFGFARLASEDPGASHVLTQVRGTVGYLDPEYISTYELTEKSDVYSFGVVLVELMTGRQPVQSERPIKERITTRWALQALKEGCAVVAMDPRLQRSPASIEALEKVLRLARHCLAPNRQSRPSMKQCGEVLWGIRKDFREKNNVRAVSTAHYSEQIDVRKDNREMFGIEDGESYEFRSA